MTLYELNQHLKLLEMREKQQETLDTLRESIGAKTRCLTGMPRGTGVADPTAAVTIAIDELEKAIQSMDAEIEQSQTMVEQFLQTVDDLKLRTLLRLRFVAGMPWKQVSAATDKYTTECGAKSYCYRYLRNLEVPAIG